MSRAACGIVALAVAACTSAWVAARELPPIAFLLMGYRELGVTEAAAGPGGSVALSTDLTGDGIVDEARVLVHDERNSGLIVVVAPSRDKVDTYVLSQPSAADARRTRLSMVRVREKRAIVIMAADGSSETLLFDGREFGTVPR